MLDLLVLRNGKFRLFLPWSSKFLAFHDRACAANIPYLTGTPPNLDTCDVRVGFYFQTLFLSRISRETAVGEAGKTTRRFSGLLP